MALSLDLPPELEARLRDEAARRGRDVADFARFLLECSLRVPGSPPAPERPFYETATDEEWLREFHDFLEEFRDNDAPPIPLEALRRENIYEDRGL